MTTIHNPGNESEIDTVYAYMSIDAQGRHGIIATVLSGFGATPLIAGNRRVAKLMQPYAEEVAKLTGERVGLFAFERRTGEPIWDFRP